MPARGYECYLRVVNLVFHWSLYNKFQYCNIMYSSTVPNNFFGLSVDKTDHVIHNRAIAIRRYPPSDLRFII